MTSSRGRRSSAAAHNPSSSSSSSRGSSMMQPPPPPHARQHRRTPRARPASAAARTASRRSRVHHQHAGPACRAAATQNQSQQQQPALLYDLHGALVPYERAWAWQRARVAQLCDAATRDRRDTVFLLQHPPVYTLGAGSDEGHVKFDLAAPPHPLYRTERGGEVTYHGPGQLVVYPILDLSRHTQDLHWYLRSLEEVVVRALASTSGLTGERLPGLTGVWVDGHKLAAIGVRARKWVTYHGLALNVSTDLQPFQFITPCGIADRPVGSVRTALGMEPTPPARSGSEDSSSSSSSSDSSSSDSSRSSNSGDAKAAARLQAIVRDPLVVEYRYALVEALEDVFGLQLQPASHEQVQTLLSSSSSSGATDAAPVTVAH